MKSESRDIELFGHFLEERRRLAESDSFEGMMSFDEIIPQTEKPDFVLTTMANDFLMDLTGAINTFYFNVLEADAWNRSVKDLPEDTKWNCMFQYAEPHLELGLNRPYAIRSRMIFTMVHLLHTASKWRSPQGSLRLPKEGSINWKTLKKFAGEKETSRHFLDRLSRLNDERFSKETNNYRNTSHHQFPVHLGIGLTSRFLARDNEQGTSYTYCTLPALKVSAVINLLYQQHDMARKALDAYRALTEELVTPDP